MALEYGRRLLPAVLDSLADSDPTRLYAVIPKTSNMKDGFRDISVADIARAANSMAQWIEDRFGRGDNFETICFMGVSDLRGPVTFLAAVKCGYKLLLLSPRNAPSTNSSLMEQTGCSKLLYAAEVAPIVQRMGAASSLRSEVIPTFEEMLSTSPVSYPYTKSFEDAKNDPVVVLHSSGSTGIPRPITMTHGTFAAFDNEHNLPRVPGRKNRDTTVWSFDGEARVYMVFPFFHLGGFLFLTVNAIFRNSSSVLGPPHMVPDGQLLKEILMQQKLRAMFLVPSVIEQLLAEPDGISFFTDVDFVAYSGAPSTPEIGDRLSQVVELISPFGSTETGQLPELALPREDWAWHEFHPNYSHEMQVYDPAQGIFELVVLADETTMVHHNLPGITVYHTKDLFTQHPQRPSLFKYYGRRDDIIVLGNGEKFNPIPLELEVQAHPELKGALVVGNGRTQAVILIEPNADHVDPKLPDRVWPLIEKSNSLVAGQGRISRAMIICASPDKPFARTGKGTVVRKLTEQAYKDEIEQSYSSADGDLDVMMELIPTLAYNQAAVIQFLRQVLTLTSFSPGSTIREDENFYVHGLDSLQTIEMTKRLRRNLASKTSKPVSWLSARTIFQNATLAELSGVLAAFLNDGQIPEEETRATRARAVKTTVARLVGELPAKATMQPLATTTTSTVALVGSFGYLGSHLLAALLKDPQISEIHCLSRASRTPEDHAACLKSLDQSLEPYLRKLVFTAINIGQRHLGLDDESFSSMASRVDVVIYNAWKSDFGVSIRSFDPFLSAARDLVEMSIAGGRRARMVFISSMSSVHNLATVSTVPERPVEDPMAALDMGYGQAKLASEQILATAGHRGLAPVTIVRIPQLGGSLQESGTRHVWADQGWISALMQTSLTLQCIPNPVGPVDWVPVDVVASMIHRFVVHQPDSDVQFFNVYPRNPQHWRIFVNAVQKKLGVSEIVTMSGWLEKLRKITDPSAEELDKLPALKMLDYFEAIGDGNDVPSYATADAQRVSGIEVHPVDEAVLERWLDNYSM
ncbi:acetyl-CoA synthetase-like protein [Hypoxylon cercidicola]|nr:acetyl-CoA synthetase-like protein [Hypoxylon cercidicola]